MRYLLDFDGVLLDIEGLKAKMAALGFQESERTAKLFSDMRMIEPQFSVRDFLFPDAQAFLHEYAHDCYVVSSYLSSKPGNNKDEEEARRYQEEKIRESSVTELLGEERIHVVGQSKSEALAALAAQCAGTGETCVFIDDREQFVKEAQALGIAALHMDRNGREKVGDRVVTTFDGLKEKISAWNI